MGLFSNPVIGGIIEKNISGVDYILAQDRCKDDARSELGLIEILAVKYITL